MKSGFKLFFLSILLGTSFLSFSQQTDEIKLNAGKVKMFLPYMEWMHGGKQAFPAWKNNNKMLYAKEMWYLSESFYVKRNVLPEGATLDESMIYISRFENQRKQDEEVTIPMPGFKDAIVLIPGNKLIYKP
jgi:hypothetical protein